MKWQVTISLKDGSFVTIEDLISVDRKMIDGSAKQTTEFSSFQLPDGQLSFVGVNEVVAIHSREIKYVQLSQD